MKIRRAIEKLHNEMSRRAFLTRSLQAGSVAVFWERFGEQLFGADRRGGSAALVTDTKAVFSAMGNVVIPVDSDPGWATFEPQITDYALDVMLKQVLLGGDQLLFLGLMTTFTTFNEIPPLIDYGARRFLEMAVQEQSQYFADVLSGQFENDGAQDVLFLAAFVGLFTTKAVFFSNFPKHLPVPGAEYQVRPNDGVRTGWDIMGYRGPVGPEEEQQLREKYFNIEVLPGMDPKNTLI